MANEFKNIISRLEKQKAAIDLALGALRQVDDTADDETAAVSRGGRKKTARTKTVKKAAKRMISDEGRRRMAEAQQKRWAATRKAAKKATKKATRSGAKKTAGSAA